MFHPLAPSARGAGAEPRRSARALDGIDLVGRALLSALLLPLACTGAAQAPPPPRATAAAGEVPPAAALPSPLDASATLPEDDASYPFDPFDAIRFKKPFPAPLPAGVTLRLGHARDRGFPPEHIAATGDGSRWAACTVAQELWLWDAAKGLPERHVGDVPHDDGCEGIRFSGDGKHLFVAGVQSGRDLDLDTGKIQQIPYHGEEGGLPVSGFRARHLGPGPRGGFVVAGCAAPGSASVLVLQGDPTRVTKTLGGSPPGGEDVCAYSAAASPDGRWIAAGGPDEVIVHSTATWQIAARLPVGRAHAIAFSADSGRLHVGGHGAVHTFDVKTFGAVASAKFEPGSLWTDAVAPSADGAAVFAVSGGLLKAFDVATGHELWSRGGDIGGELLVTPRGELLAVSRRPAQIARFTRSGARLGPYDQGRHDGWIGKIAFFDADRRVLTSGDDGDTRVWDAADGAPLVTFARRPSGGGAISRLRPGTRQVITAPERCSLHVWDVDARAIRGRLLLDEEAPCSVAGMDVSPDGSLAAIADGEGTVRLADLAALRWLETVPIGAGTEPSEIAFSRDGATLWLSVKTGLVAIDVQARAVAARRVPFERADRGAFALVPDRGVAVIGDGHEAFAVSLATGKLVWRTPIPGALYGIRSVISLPSRDQVAIGTRNAALLLDAATGQVVRTYTGDDPWADATALAVSSDERRLAAGFRSVVWVWDL